MSAQIAFGIDTANGAKNVKRAAAIVSACGILFHRRGQLHLHQSKWPPSPEQVAKHDLTHEPYEEWCEICVSHRGRQDRHPAADITHTHTEHATVSFDFGFATRTATMEAEAGEASKVVFLACHDKHTGLIGAIPSPDKGGKHFTYLVTSCDRTYKICCEHWTP